MIFYNLSIPAKHQTALASYSNRTKVYESIKFILKNYESVEFVGIFDVQKKKKVNHKNLSIAISLLNENEAFGLQFMNKHQQPELLIDITKMRMNPDHSTILLPANINL